MDRIRLLALACLLALAACGERDPCEELDGLSRDDPDFANVAAECQVQQNEQILEELRDDDVDD